MIDRTNTNNLFTRALKCCAFIFLLCQFLSTNTVWGKSLIEKNGNGIIDWTEGIITVKGTGAPPANMPAGQSRLMAKRAAIADGYRNLAELINGVQVTSETTVKNFVTESDVIQTKVQGFIKGALVVNEKNLADGTVEVMISVNLVGNDSLASIVLPEMESLPAPSLPEAAPESKEQYTGLIIDSRLIQLEPSLASAVTDEFTIRVYDPGFVEPEVLITKGYAMYIMEDGGQESGINPEWFFNPERDFRIAFLSPSDFVTDGELDKPFYVANLWKKLKKGFKKINKLIERVGENPLVIQALGGGNLKSKIIDALVPEKYRKKVEEARYYYDFLKEAQVAFVTGQQDNVETGWAK